MRRPALIALVLAVLTALPWAVKQIAVPCETDFMVYYTASMLVAEHRGSAIYDQADNGIDPQLRFAPHDSLFYRTALSKGFTGVRLYVYPPTLADAMVPLAPLSGKHACDAWLTINLLCIFATGVLLLSLLEIPLQSMQAAVLMLLLFLFRANIWAAYQGQISVVLLALWTAATVAFHKGWLRTSAFLFAFAACIKLTPLLVILPMLLWKQWKWLGWFTASLAGIVIVTAMIDGPSTLVDYVRHVTPAMSTGIVHPQNVSLPAAISELYAGLTHQDLLAGFTFREETGSPFYIPHWVMQLGKALSALLLCSVMYVVYRKGRLAPMDRVKVLCLVALLSQCIAPVAWRHGYTYACLPLVLLWWDALHAPRTRTELAFLAFCTVEFGFVFDSIVSHSSTGLGLAVTSFFVPVTCIALIFYGLSKMQKKHRRPLSG